MSALSTMPSDTAMAPSSVARRLEEPYNLFSLHALLERLQLLRALAHLDISDADGVFLVHHEHQSRDASLAGTVVLHLGDGDIVAFWHIPVAVREDAEIDVGVIHMPSDTAMAPSSEAGRSSIGMARKPCRLQASIASFRCSGRSRAVLLIITRFCSGMD